MPVNHDNDTPQLQNPVAPHDHIFGSKDAPVTLVEYGDYECSYCGQAYLIINKILREMSSDVCYVFRNFPLTQLHHQAMNAALAAEAAGAQGNYWEMHDILYENQSNLQMEDLLTYALQLNLDRDRFIADIENAHFLAKVREDFRSGVQSGVKGTPTFFLNGFRYEGSWDFDSLISALRAAAEGSQKRRIV